MLQDIILDKSFYLKIITLVRAAYFSRIFIYIPSELQI